MVSTHEHVPKRRYRILKAEIIPFTDIPEKGAAEMSKTMLRRAAVRSMTLVAAFGVAALLGVPQASASTAPSLQHAGVAVPALTSRGETSSLRIEILQPRLRMPACSPIADGDHVHGPSSGDASGHGWWLRGNCKVNLARVQILLQESIGGTWGDVGMPGVGTVPAGGGSGRWVNARATCASSTQTKWRSVINVSTIGQPGADEFTTATQSLACRA